ncbi:MAG: hypothetical protein Q9160_007302 [Pyrenula sp. 1 TL-2023]
MVPRPLHFVFLLLVPIQATSFSFGVSVPFALAQFVHWTIEVNGICYEVVGEKATDGKKIYGVKRSSYETWLRRRGRRGNVVRRRLVGMTELTASELWNEASHIWETRFHNTYKVDTQNCQNFAYLFYKQTHLHSHDSRITNSQRRSFKPFPRRLTRFTELTIRRTLQVAAVGVIANPEALVLYGLATILPTIILRCKDKKWLNKENKADDMWLEQVYQGFNVDMVNDIADWGFEVDEVVATLRYLGYHNHGGRYLYLTQEDWEELDDKLHTKAKAEAEYGGFDNFLVDDIAGRRFTVRDVVATLHDLHYGPRDNDLDDEEFREVVDAVAKKVHDAARNRARMSMIGGKEDAQLRIGY